MKVRGRPRAAAPDRRLASARRDPGGGQRARRRAARRREGARRAPHARRPRPQRPRPRVRAGHASRSSSSCPIERYSHIMHIVSTVVGALAPRAHGVRRARRDLPGRHALGRAQAARDGDHRRARAGAPRRVRRRAWATSTSPATSTPPSRSAPRVIKDGVAHVQAGGRARGRLGARDRGRRSAATRRPRCCARWPWRPRCARPARDRRRPGVRGRRAPPRRAAAAYAVALGCSPSARRCSSSAPGAAWATPVVAEAGLPSIAVDARGPRAQPAARRVALLALAGIAGLVATRSRRARRSPARCWCCAARAGGASVLSFGADARDLDGAVDRRRRSSARRPACRSSRPALTVAPWWVRRGWSAACSSCSPAALAVAARAAAGRGWGAATSATARPATAAARRRGRSARLEPGSSSTRASTRRSTRRRATRARGRPATPDATPARAWHNDRRRPAARPP